MKMIAKMKIFSSKKILFISLLAFLFFISRPANSSYPDEARRMEPMQSELLDRPIYPISCRGLKIVEWRPTPGSLHATSPNKKSISIINNICKLVFSEYINFLEKEGFSRKVDYLNATKRSSACLMPADINDHGTDFRNLNDNIFRFKDRRVHGVEYFWGYYDYNLKTIFSTNDPIDINENINNNFESVFAHELYHAISHYTGIYYEVGVEEEEAMAQRFTDYLGLEVIY